LRFLVFATLQLDESVSFHPEPKLHPHPHWCIRPPAFRATGDIRNILYQTPEKEYENISVRSLGLIHEKQGE